MLLNTIKDPATREALNEMDRRVRKVEGRSISLSRSVVTGAGGVRTGPLSERGVAADRHPEIYIAVETTTATFYYTTPTLIGPGGYDWAQMAQVTLT